ncbi:outer membrane protein OmpA-like peptidoglycan-associated protein [Neisseria sp. HSC-16F19]|nr:OmpA family protein [Neisseria sp. HSC-16F19]MCP2041492.1 outer membrane protein OmpA-like peptidoglycan-associated protein [Neisseria sp. HSC-16F19]
MQIRTSLAAGAALAALVLSGCVTDPTTGQQRVSKTAMYGLGAAATCGIVGAVTHGSKGARNSALACGAIGAGVGGYMDYQEKLLRDKLANSQVEVERVGDQIKLVMPENITFATGSAALSPAATSSLTSVAEVLAKYTDTTITIAGHTDSTGSDAINNPLSENRARSVADFLYNRGVASNRMRTTGYGSRQPIASNNTVEGRAKNRRVEILINPQVTQ